jgi:PAS domain-containing protein
LKRYWRPLNTPILDEQGQISGLIHSVENATEYVNFQEQLRISQKNEKVALAEIERQRPQLAAFLMQAPTAVCVLAGPELVYELVNLLYQQLFPERRLIGRALLEAMPELEGHTVVDILRHVYTTGETFEGQEITIPISRSENAPQHNASWNFICQPRRDEYGRIDGVVVFSYDVTEQVRSRQRLEEFNAALEAQVARRTQEVLAAQAEAEAQRTQLHNTFMQAPAMIALVKGPDHVFHLANPLYQQSVGARPLLGRSIREAIPELKGQSLFERLDKVYRTGEAVRANEMLVQIDQTNSGVLGSNYYNFVYEPTRDAQG